MDSRRRFGICPLCDETRLKSKVTVYSRKARDLTGYICQACIRRLSADTDNYYYVHIHSKEECKNDLNKENLV